MIGTIRSEGRSKGWARAASERGRTRSPRVPLRDPPAPDPPDLSRMAISFGGKRRTEGGGRSGPRRPPIFLPGRRTRAPSRFARSDFQGPSDPLRTLPNGEALFRRSGPAAARGDSRSVDVVSKKRKLFPGGRPASPRSLALPPNPGSERRIFDRLPFRPERDSPDDAPPRTSRPEGERRRWSLPRS